MGMSDLKIIEYLWPEVLSEPINPPVTTSKRISEFIRRKILHKYITPWFPIYEYLKYLRRQSKFKDADI